MFNEDARLDADWDNYHMFGTLYPTKEDFNDFLIENTEIIRDDWDNDKPSTESHWRDAWWEYEDDDLEF